MLKDPRFGLTHKAQSTVQELEDRLTQADSVKDRIVLMNSLSWQLRIRDSERAGQLSLESLDVSRSIGYEDGIARSLVNLAFLDGEAGRLDVSLGRSLEALSHLKDQFKQDTLIGAWYTIGWTHYYLGNYPAALEFGLKALKLAQDLQYREWEAWCLDLSASTFKEGTQALQMYKSAFAIFEELGNIEGQSRILNNWACTLLDSKEFTAALEMAQKSLYLAKLGGLNRDEINVTTTIGEILTGMGEYSEAQAKLTDATTLFDKYGRDISSIFVLVDLGHVHLEQDHLDQAEQKLLYALEEATKMEMRNEQARCHQYLSAVFERRGRFDKALEHYKNFQALRENISGETASKELSALRVSHQIENAQRDAEIHRLQREKLQNELDEHKRLHAILEELATRDPLTNLFNRRHFMNLAEQEWKRAIRYQHPLCALMLDVDHFKQINDEHGHAAGDTALTSFANIIRSTLRSTEVAARYGGDEFVILLPETQPASGLIVANRIRQTIIDYAVNTESGPIELTPSIGLASVTRENTNSVRSLSELLNHADKALYIAKRAGGGQVRQYSAEA